MRAMNKPSRLFSLAAALAATLSFAGCATSTARIDKAKGSVYQTEYPTVWNAVLAATKSEGYDRIKVEDAQNGRLVSDWHKIERVADSQSTDPHVRGGMDSSGALFFRVMVTIEGKQPPYKVYVDGEAARYRPGYSSLFPYKHGVDDEPEWVNGRINALYVAVLNQLEQYAVPAGSVSATPQAAPAAPAPAEAPEAAPVAQPADATGSTTPATGSTPSPTPAPAPATAPTPAPAPTPPPPAPTPGTGKP
jgi:hypothetical protein